MKEWWYKQRIKGRMHQMFRAGQLQLTFKHQSNDHPIFPKVQSVRFLDHVEVVFTLPKGMNPEEIRKKEYIFHQFWGKNIEIEDDVIKCVLRIFLDDFERKLAFDPSQILPQISNYLLPVVAGKNKFGEWVHYDMAEHPHLLVSGETGSGKSVFLRQLISTWIMHARPGSLKLYLCDLKRSEFHLFRNRVNVEKVMTKKEELLPILLTVKKEMQKRGDMLDEAGLAHVKDLPDPPPVIVVAIDEFVMLKGEKEIMKILDEIAALGRSLCIFLTLSCQRGDAKLMEGSLKNNLTVKAGFRCSNAINAKIAGTPGAEKIKMSDKGRMILSLEELVEVQAPFLELQGAKDLLDGYTNPKTEETSLKIESEASEGDVKEDDNQKLFEVLDE